MRLYRSFYVEQGWSPERINALTPKQLLAIAGDEPTPARRASYASVGDAVADFMKGKAEERARAEKLDEAKRQLADKAAVHVEGSAEH